MKSRSKKIFYFSRTAIFQKNISIFRNQKKKISLKKLYFSVDKR